MDLIANHTPFFYFIQPLWRDEAFSVLLSSSSFLKTIQLTTFDFNPPLYYLILNLWMKLFGRSEIAVRFLSFLFHALLIIKVDEFFAKLYKLSVPKLYLLLFLTFGNPMLLYFAFEARMYSLLALFSFLTVSSLWKNDFKKFTLFAVLGLYTHYYMIFVLLSCAIFSILQKREKLAIFLKKSSLIFLAFLPWLIVVFNQLKNAGQTWFYPVDLRLVLSVLGNLYLGFEGTPDFLWNFSTVLSLLFFFFIIFYLLRIKDKKEKGLAVFFSLWLFVPLAIVIGFSFIKPIFVNRYLIFSTLPLVFLAFLSINSLKNIFFRNTLLIINVLFVVFFNIWFAPFHKKVDFRRTLAEINTQDLKNALIVSQTPLSFFEVSYYAKDRSQVFLYNPNSQQLPSYVGRVLIPFDKWINTLSWGKIIYLVQDDGTFLKIVNK